MLQQTQQWRRRASSLVVAGFAVMPAFPVLAAQELVTLVPETANAALWVNNVATMKSSFEGSPIGRFWADPALEQLRGVVNDGITKDLDEEAKLAWENAATHLKGGVVVYFQADASVEDGTIVMIAEVDDAGAEWLKTELLKFEDEEVGKKDTYTAGATTVYRVETLSKEEAEELDVDLGLDDSTSMEGESTPEPTATPTVTQNFYHYAQTNGYFLMAYGKNEELIKTSVATLAGETKTVSLKEKVFTTLPAGATSSGNDTIGAYANVASLVDLMVEQIKKESEDPTANPEGLAKALGLRDMNHLLVSMSAAPDALTTQFFVTTASEKTGLLKAWVDAGPTPLNRLALAPADAHSVSSFSLDVGKLWDALLQVAESISPGASGFVGMYAMGAQGQLGINPIDAILRNISGEHVVVARPLDKETLKKVQDEGVPVADSMTMYFGLQNGEAVVQALNTALAKLQEADQLPVTTKVEEGVTTILPKEDMPLPGSMTPGVAYSKDAIAYSNNPAELQSAVRSLNGKNTAPITENPGLKAELEKVERTGLYTFSYSTAEGMTGWLDQIRDLVNRGAAGDLGQEITPEMIPSSEVARKYLGDSVSTTHVRDTHIVGHSVVRAPKAP